MLVAEFDDDEDDDGAETEVVVLGLRRSGRLAGGALFGFPMVTAAPAGRLSVLKIIREIG